MVQTVRLIATGLVLFAALFVLPVASADPYVNFKFKVKWDGIAYSCLTDLVEGDFDESFECEASSTACEVREEGGGLCRNATLMVGKPGYTLFDGLCLYPAEIVFELINPSGSESSMEVIGRFCHTSNDLSFLEGTLTCLPGTTGNVVESCIGQAHGLFKSPEDNSSTVDSFWVFAAVNQ